MPGRRKGSRHMLTAAHPPWNHSYWSALHLTAARHPELDHRARYRRPPHRENAFQSGLPAASDGLSATVQNPHVFPSPFLLNRRDAIVPHFHFNVLDGTAYIDKIGVELASLNEAKREAMRYAGAMLADSAGVSRPDREWRIEVTDHQGLALFRLAVSMMDPPEAERGKPT